MGTKVTVHCATQLCSSTRLPSNVYWLQHVKYNQCYDKAHKHGCFCIAATKSEHSASMITHLFD